MSGLSHTELAVIRTLDAEAHELTAASYRKQAAARALEGDIDSAVHCKSLAISYDGYAKSYREMASAFEAEA